MDMNKWRDYERKHKDLHIKYRNKRIFLVILWLFCAITLTAVIVIFKTKLGAQLLFMFILFLNLFLAVIFVRKISEQCRFEKHQVALLREEEPIGKFRI